MPSKEYRVPLVGIYNTRVGSIQAQPTTSGYIGVGIAGIMVIGSTVASSTKDGRMVNCFNETYSDPVTGSKHIYCVKRAGWETHTTPAAGNVGSAILVWTGYSTGDHVMTCFGASNSTLYDGTTSKGAITGQATGITETVVTTTPTLLISSSDSTAWYFDAGATVAVATKVTDADFPGNAGYTVVGTFAHIDGYACIMTSDGTLWVSDLNSVTGWTANSFASASTYPDAGIGCVRYKQYVMAFGTGSVEFFYNAGQTPCPLVKSPSLTVKVGAIAATAIATLSDVVFWCGSTPQGGLSIFKYDGSGISRVSTPEIDTILLTAGASAIQLTTLRSAGRSFVLILASGRTMAFCIEESSWHEWQGAATLWSLCVGNSSGSRLVNYCISRGETTGKVYKQDQAALYFTDDGVAYSATPQMSPMDLGTKRRKYWESIEIIGDQQTSTSSLSIAYSDDDYQSATTWGAVDLTSDHPFATRLGSSRRRAWIFAHSDNTPMRIEAIVIRASIGTT